MILVDTSSWIEALRSKGDTFVRERVRKLITDGNAAWCDLVAVELWNGAQGSYEKKKLAELEEEITCLPTSDEVWKIARKLAQECREAGKTVPAADLVILSCALFHGTGIEHCDSHFDLILRIHSAG